MHPILGTNNFDKKSRQQSINKHLALVRQDVWWPGISTQELTSECIITHMKYFFARHGIPDVVRSFLRLYIGSPYKKFAKEHDLEILTLSQSNGVIESHVKNFKKSCDP